MKNQLIKISALMITLSPLVACTRVPVGAFGVSGSDGANAISVDAGANTLEEKKLTRLKQIDQKIQESADKLNAVLDPNKVSEPANLDKLVIGDELDPSLSYDRRFSANQKIEQKMDQKAQDLISGEASATSTSTLTPTDSSLLNDRSLRNQASIDQNLNEKAANPGGDSSVETASSPAPSAETDSDTSLEKKSETSSDQSTNTDNKTPAF
ncbi:hypothetical protein COW36_05360 [bacterium (Candidatus Blackallbacteria) CG17_big_fil_post_rev_8_21_14_2_50_48_46]|uniref:Lipoprotein n=1 Tax=bacterium (Candidatus Blackallbacteria) CG17_big_fil_post_rev_8_21_14_2_50_48_46 TaxID=2014261 RepID=A0A2M7G7Y4_9BACT|nr:MAG: hypothetical protein COW64_20955 [bacterium (Candidatus Blackallbacteria) CG18_big_fil_WC_8_21_14_2_50_49_26]PIW18197.1 MAG: hypothetical protein COW36_05360 [bacterium (Candidatus Blackallbacteria) CG17_big_fil_post_rev_8_21_14_2_50_48_46]PIW50628.1 MAG: hypothetical protein COW20_01625 [bacterium (Candidatus Blackallbacteria) CG13_big_fil_rev_8_21_14_2_50_49_14]